MRKLRQAPAVRIAIALLVVAAGLAGCSEKAKSPTEASAAAGPTVAAEASRTGAGHGHGGHPQLELDIRPHVWNLQWKNAQGTVQAFVTGPNLDQVDPTSAELAGDGGGAAIHPTWTRLVRHQFMARFGKRDAIGLFPGGKRGEKHTVTLSFRQNGAATHLSDSIRLVGPTGGSPSTDAGD